MKVRFMLDDDVPGFEKGKEANPPRDEALWWIQHWRAVLWNEHRIKTATGRSGGTVTIYQVKEEEQ